MSTLEALRTALTGRYDLQRELGAGGMATVYLARDVRHNRQVALKVLHPELSAVLGPERFLKEIELTANLQHPHILPLFDSGEAGGQLFYVMPFVEGESLRARLDREQQLSIPDAIALAREVAGALHYAHERGVVHRDIKPENILLQGGHALVADFGIALAVQQAGGQRMTQTGLSLGTPQYMAPEQAMGERTVDARADVYALGAVTYEMLTGEPPFTGPSSQAIVARVLTVPPAPPTQTRSTVPAHVEAAVLAALQKVPADRFASAQKFAEALITPTTAMPAASTPPSPPDAPPTAGGRTPTLALVATLMLAISVGAWGWLRPHAGSPADELPVSAQFTVEFPAGTTFDNIYAPLAITSDGRTLIFRGTVNGEAQAMRRDLDKLEITPIPGTANAGWFNVSPDDEWLLYAEGNGVGGSGQIHRLSLRGGQPTNIVARGEQLTWLGNDSLLLGLPSLRVASVTGSDSGRVAVAVDRQRGEVSMRWPLVLDDRRHAIYTSWGNDGLAGARLAIADLQAHTSRPLDLAGVMTLGISDHRLYWVTLGGTVMSVRFDAKTLTPQGAPREHLRGVFVAPNVGHARAVLSASGTLAYLMDDGMWSNLVLFDRRGGSVKSVSMTNVSSVASPKWSPDGRRIAVEIVSAQGAFDVGVVDPSTGSVQRLTSDGKSRTPVWSADARSVYFISWRSGSGMIWRQPADGTGTAEQVGVVGNATQLAASLDSTRLAVLDGSTVRAFDIGARTMRDVFTETTQVEHLALSPNGRWISYTSTSGSRRQVVARPFPGGGAPLPLTIEEGGEPVWSADGRTLFYLSSREQMRSLSIEEGATLRVTGRHDEVNGPYFALGASNRQHFDAAPDGQHFAGLRRLNARPRLIVITNWRQQVEASLATTRPE
ncbi:MAG: protein kinase [Gemmatimonadaceae bacterium]|nr:protein kinase [Gemmatimonadaceae bacterium]